MAKIGKKASKSTNPKQAITNVVIVQDKSASMSGWHVRAVEALNSQIEAIKQGAKANAQETRLTILPFAGNTELPLFYDKEISACDPLSIFAYRSDGGSTALLDATHEAIQRISLLGQTRSAYADNVYLVVVITDGQENASRRVSKWTLADKIANLSKTDSWTFSILGPPGSKFTLQGLGFPAGNIREWEQSDQGFRDIEVATQDAYSGYFTSRAKGIRSTSAFFETDLSNVGTKDVKKLDVVASSEYRIFTVEKEMPVREFVELKTKEPYVLGSTYYLLTKREKVQDHKDLLIQDRKTKQVYGDGAKIRELLGFPQGTGEVKVDPGNHANWNLFVQSTSTNRKLVRGTTVLVAK